MHIDGIQKKTNPLLKHWKEITDQGLIIYKTTYIKTPQGIRKITTELKE